MKKVGILIIAVMIFSIINIFAAPELTDLGFTSDDGGGPITMQGNLERGFFLVNNNNPLTNYEIQFSGNTDLIDGPLKDEMFPLTLVDSTTPIQDLQDYYDARGVPEPYLSYLKNATEGNEPFAYINGSTLKLVDSAQYDLPPNIQIGMIVPGDYPTGIYTVNGTIENADSETTEISFKLVVGIVIQNKVNITCAFESDNITISADLIGNVNSAWVSYIINNTQYNKTALIGPGNYYYIIPSNELVGGENVVWNIYANNSEGNLFKNGNKTFYVRNNTYLGITPYPADGLNDWYVTEPIFSLTKDLTGGDIYYRWDSDDLLSYTVPFGLEDIPNPDSVSAGTLELNWWTEFVCGNESTQTQLFYVDLKNPVITNLKPANSSTVYNDLKPEISAYLDEIYQSNSAINKSTIIIKVNGIDVTGDANISTADSLDAIVNYTPTTNLSVGKHNVTINVTDNAGRNSELTWSFEIELTPQFNLTVHSPESIVYDTKRVGFNITTTEEVEKIEYKNWNDRVPRFKKLCRDCDEYGYFRKKVKPLKEGKNNITIRATGNFGLSKEENISLIVDSKKPKISRTLPKRNSVVNGSYFYIKYSEDNLENITLFWNGSKELTSCEAGKYKECTTSVDLTSHDGEYIEYYFNVSDVITTVQSRKTKVLVDTTSPEITIYLPITQTYYSRRVPFEINLTEEVNLEYKDLNATNPRWKKLCTRCDEYGISRAKRKTFTKGPHNLLIRAIDKAGNSDIEAIKFEVDY